MRPAMGFRSPSIKTTHSGTVLSRLECKEESLIYLSSLKPNHQDLALVITEGAEAIGRQMHENIKQIPFASCHCTFQVQLLSVQKVLMA